MSAGSREPVVIGAGIDPFLLSGRGITLGAISVGSRADFAAINRAIAMHHLHPGGYRSLWQAKSDTTSSSSGFQQEASPQKAGSVPRLLVQVTETEYRCSRVFAMAVLREIAVAARPEPGDAPRSREQSDRSLQIGPGGLAGSVARPRAYAIFPALRVADERPEFPSRNTAVAVLRFDGVRKKSSSPHCAAVRNGTDLFSRCRAWRHSDLARSRCER